MGAIQPRVCIQPQSRRSPRYYITMIIRAPSRVFQFQDSQHSFKDCMDYILPGLHWKRFTTPCRRQHHCSLHCVAFPYLTAYLQVFFSFYIFWPIRIWPDRVAWNTELLIYSGMKEWRRQQLRTSSVDSWIHKKNERSAWGSRKSKSYWPICRVIPETSKFPWSLSKEIHILYKK